MNHPSPVHPLSPGSYSDGPLVIVGGRFEKNNHLILDEIKRLAGGPLGILATASEIPDEIGHHVVRNFQSHGIDAQLIPLHGDQRERNAYDLAIVDAISSASGIYFTGGDQRRIMQTFVQQSVETPALAALRELHHRGALIAGSSAGAAVMSDPVILRGTSMSALTQGIAEKPGQPGVELGTGFGFFGWGVTDQHFIRRGRIGRLAVALQASGRRYGFGIDENTALVVEGTTARVVGETGIILIDASRARFGSQTDEIDSVWMSYIDNGDAIDLAERKVIPGPEKSPLLVSDSSYRMPAPTSTNAFGTYTLHELLFRLMQGDPQHYPLQSATAFSRTKHARVTVEMERVAGRSEVLVASARNNPRFTAIDIRLQFTADSLASEARRRGVPDEGYPATSGPLLLLGSNPTAWPQHLDSDWVRDLSQPVGIIAAASGTPSDTAKAYAQWLDNFGVASEILDLTHANATLRNNDDAFLQHVSRMRTFLFTGGDQRRLTRTLRRRGESTRVFRKIQQAHTEGATLIGVGASAAAFGTRMIAQGSSRQALLHGSSEDAGHNGILIDDGLGFFRTGLVDQNFIRRHRLGRLIVACAEEGFDLGIGLSETGGVHLDETHGTFTVFGGEGVYFAALDQEKLRLDEQTFAIDDVKLRRKLPGELHGPESDVHHGTDMNDTEHKSLNEMVTALIRECGDAPRGTPTCEGSWVKLALSAESPALLDVHSYRVTD